MSKPRRKYWGYVRNILYDYPRMRAELDALQTPLRTTGDTQRGGRGNNRPAENMALCTLPDPQEQRELEAVETAMWKTRALPDGDIRLSIIQMVFFRRSHTLQGAADKVHLSYMSARRRQMSFLQLVAQNLGLVEKVNPKSQKSDVS